MERESLFVIFVVVISITTSCHGCAVQQRPRNGPSVGWDLTSRRLGSSGSRVRPMGRMPPRTHDIRPEQETNLGPELPSLVSKSDDFRLIDVNHNGFVTRLEWAQAFAYLLENYDANTDGMLSLSELEPTLSVRPAIVTKQPRRIEPVIVTKRPRDIEPAVIATRNEPPPVRVRVDTVDRPHFPFILPHRTTPVKGVAAGPPEIGEFEPAMIATRNEPPPDRAPVDTVDRPVVPYIRPHRITPVQSAAAGPREIEEARHPYRNPNKQRVPYHPR